MDRNAALFPTTILVLFLMPGLLSGQIMARAQGADITDGESQTDMLRLDAIVLDLDSKAGREVLDHLSLPSDATVVRAAVTVIPGPGMSSGKDPQGVQIYPEEPQVDMGADGTLEWAFKGTGYGSAGRQTLFKDGSGEVLIGSPSANSNHSWSGKGGPYPSSATIKLPRGSHVSSAHLLITPVTSQQWFDSDWAKRVPLSLTWDDREDLGPVRIEHEVVLGAISSERDIRDELLLTLVSGDEEEPYPFWVVQHGKGKATIGFDADLSGGEGVRRFNLYFENPSVDKGTAKENEPVPIKTVLRNQTIGSTTVDGGPISLDRPHGLYVDEGHVLVADTNNQRVVVMTRTGELELVLGEGGVPGSDDGHLNCPHDVLKDEKGRIVVADTCNHRVQVFAANGILLNTIGETGTVGSDDEHLFFPWSVALDRSGRLYVSDMGNERIQVYSSVLTTEAFDTIGVTGLTGGDSRRFDCPRGIAVPDGLYVTDSHNSRVQYFETRDDHWADMTLGLTHLIEPTDVASTGDRTYVSDAGPSRITVFDSNGFPLEDITGLLQPMGVAVGPGRDLWISDTGRDRLVRLVEADLTVGAVEELALPKVFSIKLDGRPLLQMTGHLTASLSLEGLEATFMEALEKADGRTDQYGNEMCEVELAVEGLRPGTGIMMNDLDIRYEFSTRVSVDLAGGTSIHENQTSMPLKASSGNGGRIILDDIELSLDRPPSIFSMPPHPPTVYEETPPMPVMDLDEVFSDEGRMTYNVEVVRGPEGGLIHIRDDGWLSVDLTGAPNSTETIEVVTWATDALGQNSTPYHIVLPIEDLEDPPMLVAASTHSLMCDEEFTTTLEAVDGDGDDIEHYLVAGPDRLVIDPSGNLSWRPRRSQVGENTVVIGITDGLHHTVVELILNVGCHGIGLDVQVDGRTSVSIGGLVRIPVQVNDSEGPYDRAQVTLLKAPRGMRFDETTREILWAPSKEQAGLHLVDISVTDGTETVERVIRVDVRRPDPWIRIRTGPNLIGDGLLSFTGEAGGLEGPVPKIECRVDNGRWNTISGGGPWRTEVTLDGLSPGVHRIEVRAYDGSYSETVQGFFIVPSKKVYGPQAQEEGGKLSWPLLITIIVVLFVLGGIVVIKRIDGYAFCVHRSPEGPTMFVPLGDHNALAGGQCDTEEGNEDEEPDQPPSKVHRCFLCLGKGKSTGDMMACPRCDRPYHKVCARRIGKCPICGQELTENGA